MNTKRLLLFFVCVCITGVFTAFYLSLNLGTMAFQALTATLSDLFSMKVGTLGTYINIILILLQIALLRNKYQKRQLLQLIVSFILGVVMNFTLYNLLKDIQINNTIVQIVAVLLCVLILSVSVGSIMVLDVVSFPLESFCLAFTTVFPKIKFSTFRQFIDVAAFLILVLLVIIYNLNWYIGVGTILSLLLFSPLLAFMIKKLTPIYTKYGFCDNQE